MSCGTCIRWRRLQRPPLAPRNWRTGFGACRAPNFGPRPYWEAEHPTGDLIVHETHGQGCPAAKEKKLR